MWICGTQIFTDHQHHSPSHYLLLLSLLEDHLQRPVGRRAMLSQQLTAHQSRELLHIVALWGGRKQWLKTSSVHFFQHFQSAWWEVQLWHYYNIRKWNENFIWKFEHHYFEYVSQYLKLKFEGCKREKSKSKKSQIWNWISCWRIYDWTGENEVHVDNEPKHTANWTQDFIRGKSGRF